MNAPSYRDPKADPLTLLTVTGATHNEARRTDLSVREIDFVIDEAVARGGTDLGPAPPEAVLGALIGCMNNIGRRIAEAEGVAVTALSFRAEADFDRRGVWLEAEIDRPIPTVRLWAEMTADGPDTGIVRVRDKTSRHCAIAVMLRAAGAELIENWTIIRTDGAPFAAR
ncbi:MAG: OsmC family protein, partial [Pseudomonadota bacterium]